MIPKMKPGSGMALIGMGTEILVLLGAFIYAGRYIAEAFGKPQAVGILSGALLALVVWVARVIKASKIPKLEVPAVTLQDPSPSFEEKVFDDPAEGLNSKDPKN